MQRYFVRLNTDILTWPWGAHWEDCDQQARIDRAMLIEANKWICGPWRSREQALSHAQKIADEYGIPTTLHSCSMTQDGVMHTEMGAVPSDWG